MTADSNLPADVVEERVEQARLKKKYRRFPPLYYLNMVMYTPGIVIVNLVTLLLCVPAGVLFFRLFNAYPELLLLLMAGVILLGIIWLLIAHSIANRVWNSLPTNVRYWIRTPITYVTTSIKNTVISLFAVASIGGLFYSTGSSDEVVHEAPTAPSIPVEVQTLNTPKPELPNNWLVPLENGEPTQRDYLTAEVQCATFGRQATYQDLRGNDRQWVTLAKKGEYWGGGRKEGKVEVITLKERGFASRYIDEQRIKKLGTKYGVICVRDL